MKNFFTSLLGALVALVIFSVGSLLCLFIFFMVLGAMVGGKGQREVSVEKGSYVVFDMTVNVTDAPTQVTTGAIMGALAGGGGEPRRMQVRQITRALEAAADDDRIAGVFLHGRFIVSDYGSGYASLKEIRDALEKVRAAKKPVIAYLEDATVREMYVASVADEVALDPYGMVQMPGLSSQPMYFAGAFEKYGIGVQVTRVGKYKSAIEPYTRKDMSPESREQMQKLLDDLWGDLRSGISKGRGMDDRKLQALVDAEGLIRPEKALESKLVNRIAYRDEIIDEMKARTGRKGSKEAFKQVSLYAYSNVVPANRGPSVPKPTGTARGTVAVVYAEGAIVDGKGSVGEVGGENYAQLIRRLRQDENVKAIVLRVNSPGGSATASEHIQREIRLAKKEKPVVVSMGTYAASGGYWISTYGDRIFAEPNTITGSIGVFGMQLDVKQLANNFGVTFDSVKTGKFADTLTISRPKTPEEMEIFQKMVDWIYDEFVSKVAESRDLPEDKVREIAQGRVWSGSEALKLGLVDELGGLDDAIIYAAEQSKLGRQYSVREYPRAKELAEVISEALGGVVPEDASGRAGAEGTLDAVMTRVKAEVHSLNQFNDPKGIYLRLPDEFMVQ